jgi:hypothetical protein
VDLTQLVRFLVVEPIHTDSNPRFDICIAFTANYSFSGRRRPHRQRCALGDRLRESKIKSAQSFRCAHKSRVYVCVHRGEYLYMYEYLRLYYVSKK